MSDAVEFDPHLYRGAAAFYDRFRVPYRSELIGHLVSRARPTGRGRLLDLACGTGQADWQTKLSAVVSTWAAKTGAYTRVPAGWDEARRRWPDAAVLDAAGFEVLGSSRFPTTHEWTVDALIGYAYSTSLLPRAVLGERAEAFEDDVRRELANFTSDDTLTETIDFGYELARRPAWPRRAVARLRG